jgi:hypothetical protein
MKRYHLLGPLAAAVGCLLTPLAHAQSASGFAPQDPSTSDLFQRPVALETLERLRGGTAVHNDMDLSGVTSGNSAFQVQTGNNTIDAGSFANMSGIPVVIQNSGANVLIQNATIVNLQMK